MYKYPDSLEKPNHILYINIKNNVGLALFPIFLLPSVAVLEKAQLPHWNQPHCICHIIGVLFLSLQV